jgi:hypothetical protein
MKAKLLSLAASCAAAGVVLASGAAQATVLMGHLTVDNGYFAYISTSDSTLGTLVSSGTYWPTANTFSTVLPAATTLYLHIEAMNQGVIAGVLGDFSLIGSGYEFANGAQTLTTETTDWTGIYNDKNSDFTPQPWVVPTGGVVSYGPNVKAGPWHHNAGISSTADWIWPTGATKSGVACLKCTVDLSTPIFATAVPEPAEWAMIITGLGMIGATARFGRRRQAVAF